MPVRDGSVLPQRWIDPMYDKKTAKRPEKPKALRVLTPAEEQGLSDAQKAYLIAHPNMVCLQLDELPRNALYQSLSHGAVTIGRAMELDELFARLAAKTKSDQIQRQAERPYYDNYSSAEDRFIDRHGMSSSLD